MRETILKECKKHGLTEHVLLENGTVKCKECIKDAVVDKRRRNKIKLVEYKGGKCEICGYDKCIDALEFHHLEPTEKEYGLSNGDTISFDKLKEEADKCILVCANCHREIHWKEREQKRREKQEKLLKNAEEFYNEHPEVRKDSKYISEVFQSEAFKIDIEKKMPKKELAKKYSIGLTTLVRYLNSNNLWYGELEEIEKLSNYTLDMFIKDFSCLKTFEGVGRKYSVSGNAIKKWCKRNNLPDKKKELYEFINK